MHPIGDRKKDAECSNGAQACLGLPEGVLLYIEGRRLDREKGIPFSEKPLGFFYLIKLKVKEQKTYSFMYLRY